MRILLPPPVNQKARVKPGQAHFIRKTASWFVVSVLTITADTGHSKVVALYTRCPSPRGSKTVKWTQRLIDSSEASGSIHAVSPGSQLTSPIWISTDQPYLDLN
ncbi:hypothetical protein RRG08_024813 [Elysia crispata]|uniref:Uncharacterized protein n=1 Tax=Elysia crispata TaxID=231223 RepID=A0AAE1CZR3_9GAST|nr:hypothetical protein RRG08_024813 [Elysia crispata]